MRKESSNQFTEGLVCDLNPINTPNTVLTDALNATIITYDSNEYSLQNDRGNYPLKNCRLKPNYIPVGLKEYGDILYIVSYNPLNDHVEIGSYPSPLNVNSSENSNCNFEIESVIGSFHESIDYSELVKRCQLLIYTGNNEEQYKIYPGDEYNINPVEVSEYKYEQLEYFIIDENRKRYNVSDIIEPDGQWHNVPWQVPGWLASQYRIGNFEDFDMSIRSLLVPTIVDEDAFECKTNLHFQFKISDELFLPVQTENTEKKSESEDKIKSDLFIKLTIRNSERDIDQKLIPLINDGEFVEWYMNSKILWTKYELAINNLHKNDNIIVEAIPYLKIESGEETRIINYDNLKEIYSFTLNTIGSSSDFHIAEGLWKFYTEPNGNQLYIEFDVSGPNVTSEIVNLYYRIHDINSNNVGAWREMHGYTGISDQISSSIEFDEIFKPESIYIIEFGFASDLESVSKTKYTTKKVIVTSAVFGDLVGTYSDFSKIYFNDWAIKGYGKGLKINKVISNPTFYDSRNPVKCDHDWNESGYLTKNGTVLFDDPILTKLWSNKSSADKGWLPAKSASNYKNVGIDVGFSKEFNTRVDTEIKEYDLLTGNLWDGLPGITMKLRDPFSKVIASKEISRQNLSEPIHLEANSNRGKTKHYGTILNSESFRNISGIEQIDKIPMITITVESVREWGNNKLKVQAFTDGIIERDPTDSFICKDKVHWWKATSTISEGTYGTSSTIPVTIHSLLKDYQIGILGVIAKEVRVTEGRYQLLHGSEEQLLSKKGQEKNRFFAYLVVRKSTSFNYTVIIPIQIENNIWNIDIEPPLEGSGDSWWNAKRKSDKVIVSDIILPWVNDFFPKIKFCTTNSALDYYNLISINVGDNAIKNADKYILEINVDGTTKWPIFENKYDLLDSNSRNKLIEDIGENICGNLFTSDSNSIEAVNVKSIEIQSDSLDNEEFESKITEFDKKISLINDMIKSPDISENKDLIAQIESRAKSRGVYYLNSDDNNAIIKALDLEYSANPNLKYVQLASISDAYATLRVKAENDDLHFARVATTLTIK